jgi:hypothetical protein
MQYIGSQYDGKSVLSDLCQIEVRLLLCRHFLAKKRPGTFYSSVVSLLWCCQYPTSILGGLLISPYVEKNVLNVEIVIGNLR